ncbi:hypothetical protein FSP39_000130 [Pinctada imbricata]|uniref:F-box domain-containing protein n=1 Tax=Pinctada imbricata TaxID=66713 RepID=A0AA88Y906_PINIB|nr:hypothetical protein FSP39_000130 [Pinctada imbricata]
MEGCGRGDKGAERAGTPCLLPTPIKGKDEWEGGRRQLEGGRREGEVRRWEKGAGQGREILYMWRETTLFDLQVSKYQLQIILESRMKFAISTEFHIPVIKKLLFNVAALAVESGQQSRIGSHSLWKRHRETVNNCIVRISNFEYSKREEDGKPCLMDLPKETLLKIMSHLSDPADITNLGQTCSYLNDISKDVYLWKHLAFFHFNDKQLLPFLEQEIFYDLEWQDIFKRCFRKHKKLKKLYGDELELCNNCRCIYWRVRHFR